MIIVLVPELEAMLADAERVPPRLAAWLARATESNLDDHHYHSQLVCGQALAPAALSRRVDRPDDAEGFWLRADPVGLRPDLNAVWIQSGLSLSQDSPACHALVELFRAEGLAFDLPHPERGYLRLSAPPRCNFEPPWNVPGQSLDLVLPKGEEQARWRRLLNDCQMHLHQAAEDHGEPLPQGLWFWGGGQLPDRSGLRPRISHLAGPDPLLASLADWLGLSYQPDCPVRPPDQSLVLWPVSRHESATVNLLALDRWLTAPWRRLRRFGLDCLQLASSARTWTLTPAAAWRIWQRKAMRAA